MGCGWLGAPLALALADSGYAVSGTTTRQDKARELEQQGISMQVIRLNESGFKGPITAFLKGLDVLVFNIPPGLRRDTSGNYPARIHHLREALEDHGIPRLIYVSSTSVFGAQGVVDEATLPQPDSESGKQLLEAEHLLAAGTPPYNLLIMRPGGLMGDGRHPVKYLSGKTGLQGGQDPVNLIHGSDARRILALAVADPEWTGVVHGVYPAHPAKADYYRAQARAMGLPLPQYQASQPNPMAKEVRSKVLEGRGFTWNDPIV